MPQERRVRVEPLRQAPESSLGDLRIPLGGLDAGLVALLHNI